MGDVRDEACGKKFMITYTDKQMVQYNESL